MNNGTKRRKKKRYRVRYDRIVVFVLIIITISVVASSCVKKLTGDNGDNSSDTSSDISASQPDESSNNENNTPTEPVSENEGEALPEPTEGSSENLVWFSKEDSLKGDLVLVNAEYEYTFPEGDIDTVTIVGNRNDCYQAGDYVTSLDKNVLIHLNELMAAYAQALGSNTTDIFVQDGFRTFEEQQERHSNGKSKTFEAGHTDYHTGRTFDMFRMNSQSATGYLYFSADEKFNAIVGDYGFILRYPEGKETYTGENARSYTYRYVGYPHAKYILSNNLCLEEYITLVKGHNKDNPLDIIEGGHTYNVYYVPAEAEGDTSVPVPADKEYTVSGCNAGGFIVTVTVG